MAVPRPAPPVSPACATALCNALPVLFSPVSLSGGLLSAVAGFPLRAGFTRRCPFPLSGAAGSYHLASTQKQHRRHTPATRVTGLRTPPKRRKTLEESLETRCPRCRSRGLPALRVLVLLLLPVFAAVQPRRKFGEWRLRLPCGARSVSAGACQGIPCSNSS
jgi:hypothetical protein